MQKMVKDFLIVFLQYLVYIFRLIFSQRTHFHKKQVLSISKMGKLISFIILSKIGVS